MQLSEISQTHAIAVVDGECALCSRSAAYIARKDTHDRVRICTSQSTLGQSLLRQAGLAADDPTSWLVLDKGVIHTQMDAVMYLGNLLGGAGYFAQVFCVLPLNLRNALYRIVAKNRIRWFGRADLCAMPSERLKAKLITDL